MKRFLTLVFVMGAIAAIGVGADEKIRMSDLPEAVRTAVERETTGSTVKGFAREREGGKTFYEVETMVDGHARDLLFDATGHLVEVEEAIDLAAAPPAVKAALESRGTIVKIETVKKNGQLTYE